MKVASYANTSLHTTYTSKIHVQTGDDNKMATSTQDELSNPVLIHDHLNPVLWDTETNKLLPDVREALLNIYNDFLSSNFTDNSVTIPVVDLHLLGSQAGYNYTEHSDIDLHLLVNFELLYEKDEVLQLLYQTVTRKFNSDLDITVKGIPVELYIQDLKSVNRSTGVYSVFEDKWIQEPGQPPEIDQETLETANEIADELITATKAILDNRDSATLEEVEQLINDIYVVRKQSLTEFSEFSAGNLAFKILRNTGMLDEIKELHKELRGQELSLAEQNKSQDLKEDHCLECGEQVDHDEKTCPYCGSSGIHRSEDDLPSPSDTVEDDNETDDGKRPYQFITAHEGYIYHNKNGKTVFRLTEKQAKDKAHYMNKEAKKKSGSNPGYKPYLVEDKKIEEKAIMKCTIKKLTEETSQKRISRYKEPDNGRVLHSWAEITDEQAQEIARKESIKNPDDIFYVAYDDVMDSSSDIRWVNGKSYNYDEVKLEGGKPVIIAEKATLEEDVDSQETYSDTSAAAQLTALVNSEIEAINLYTSVIEACPCEKTKVVLEEILQDEKDHINLLSNLIDSLVEDAFPTDETVEGIIEEAGMNPVPVEETPVVVATTDAPGTIPTVALLSEGAEDESDETSTEDIEEKTDDLMDEVKERGFEVNDDNTFSVTGSESGYTATVSVNGDDTFSVIITESNGDVLESLTITSKEDLFNYLKILKSEDEDFNDESFEYEE